MEYLNYDVTTKEDSIENIFCKALDEKGNKVPMSDIQTKFMMVLIMNKDETTIDSIYEDLAKQCFYLPVLKSRIEPLGYTVDKRTELMIAIVSGTVGSVVMYVYYLAYKAKKLKIKNITFDDLCSKFFPFGFFDKKTMDTIWDTQKVRVSFEERGSDNLLDYPQACKSLIFN